MTTPWQPCWRRLFPISWTTATGRLPRRLRLVATVPVGTVDHSGLLEKPLEDPWEQGEAPWEDPWELGIAELLLDDHDYYYGAMDG